MTPMVYQRSHFTDNFGLDPCCATRGKMLLQLVVLNWSSFTFLVLLI